MGPKQRLIVELAAESIASGRTVDEAVADAVKTIEDEIQAVRRAPSWRLSTDDEVAAEIERRLVLSTVKRPVFHRRRRRKRAPEQ